MVASLTGVGHASSTSLLPAVVSTQLHNSSKGELLLCKELEITMHAGCTVCKVMVGYAPRKNIKILPYKSGKQEKVVTMQSHAVVSFGRVPRGSGGIGGRFLEFLYPLKIILN